MKRLRAVKELLCSYTGYTSSVLQKCKGFSSLNAILVGKRDVLFNLCSCVCGYFTVSEFIGHCFRAARSKACNVFCIFIVLYMVVNLYYILEDFFAIVINNYQSKGMDSFHCLHKRYYIF